MFLRVDTDSVTATLEDPDNCDEFHVLIVGAGNEDAIDEAIAALGAGRLVGPNAFVAVHRLEELAEGRVGDDWPARFHKMLDYASSQGWMNDDRSYVMGHLKHE